MPTEKTYTVYNINELTPEAKKKALDKYRAQVSEHFSLGDDTGWPDSCKQDLINMGFVEVTRSEKYTPKINGKFLKDDLGRFVEKTREVPEYPVFEYSLSYCQGDGVAFYGPIDVWTFLNYFATTADKDDYITEARQEKAREYLRRLEEYGMTKDAHPLRAESSRNSYGHHYSHWNTMEYDWVTSPNDHIEEILAETENPNPNAPAGCTDLSDEILDFLKETFQKVSKTQEKHGYEEIDYHMDDEQLEERALEADVKFHADGRIFKE